MRNQKYRRKAKFVEIKTQIIFYGMQQNNSRLTNSNIISITLCHKWIFNNLIIIGRCKFIITSIYFHSFARFRNWLFGYMLIIYILMFQWKNGIIKMCVTKYMFDSLHPFVFIILYYCVHTEFKYSVYIL